MNALTGSDLLSRCVRMLPRGVPESAIESCYYSEDDSADGHFGQYWVDLADGYMCAASEADCATGYTLAELKAEMKTVYKL